MSTELSEQIIERLEAAEALAEAGRRWSHLRSPDNETRLLEALAAYDALTGTGP